MQNEDYNFAIGECIEWLYDEVEERLRLANLTFDVLRDKCEIEDMREENGRHIKFWGGRFFLDEDNCLCWSTEINGEEYGLCWP